MCLMLTDSLLKGFSIPGSHISTAPRTLETIGSMPRLCENSVFGAYGLCKSLFLLGRIFEKNDFSHSLCLCSAESVRGHEQMPRQSVSYPCNPSASKSTSLPNTALIEIPQRGVLGDLNDPDPGIAQEGAEQFRAF
jgi:hypothetical protein